MKKSTYITHRSGAICIAALLLSACAKESGFYDPAPINRKFDGTTLEYLQSKPGIFDSLLVAINRTGLSGTLSDSAVTLFAVTNPGVECAITNLIKISMLAGRPSGGLLTIDKEHLDIMLTHYMMRGVYPSDSMLRQD